jgi:hypothetical protein
MAKERVRVKLMYIITVGSRCSERCPQRQGQWCELFDRHLTGIPDEDSPKRQRCWPCLRIVRAPSRKDAGSKKHSVGVAEWE